MWKEQSHLENPISLILEQLKENSMQWSPLWSHIREIWIEALVAPMEEVPILQKK